MAKAFSRSPRFILSFPLEISSFNLLSRLLLNLGFFLFACLAPTIEFPFSFLLGVVRVGADDAFISGFSHLLMGFPGSIHRMQLKPVSLLQG